MTAGVPVELRVVVGDLVVVWHTSATLAMLLTRAERGSWANVWPGVADEQVFARCGGCGAPKELSVTVQARRV